MHPLPDSDCGGCLFHRQYQLCRSPSLRGNRGTRNRQHVRAGNSWAGNFPALDSGPPTPDRAWPAPQHLEPRPHAATTALERGPQPGWCGRAPARTHLAERGTGPPLPSAQPTKFRRRPAGIARGPAADARALGGRRGAAADAGGRGEGNGAAWAPSERPRAPCPPAGPAALHAPSRLPLASAAARRGRGAPSCEKLFPLQTKKGDT